MTPQDEMEEDRPIGLLDQLLSRMADIWNNKEIGVRIDEDGQEVCYYCGKSLEKYPTHKDHVFARAKGGGNDLSNFVLSCDSCNLSKQAKHPLNWIANRDIPDNLAIDYVARLLLGVYFSYRRQPISFGDAIQEWQTYKVEELNEIFLPEKIYHFHLPFYPLNEIVEVNESCSKCGCGGMKAQLPSSLLVTLRCSVCGNVKTPLIAHPTE